MPHSFSEDAPIQISWSGNERLHELSWNILCLLVCDRFLFDRLLSLCTGDKFSFWTFRLPSPVWISFHVALIEAALDAALCLFARDWRGTKRHSNFNINKTGGNLLIGRFSNYPSISKAQITLVSQVHGTTRWRQWRLNPVICNVWGLTSRDNVAVYLEARR